jgi:hypothetical protein
VSLRAAINAKCKECIYDRMAPGTWRQQVENCTCKRCPLYDVRPKSTKKPEGSHRGDE